MKRRHFLLAAPAALPFAATASSAAAQNGQIPTIGGTYDAAGRNTNGGIYTGTVTISQNGKDVDVEWTIGSQNYSGTGTLECRVLTVDWGGDFPSVYVVMGEHLHGTWDNGAALERLIPQA